MNWNEKHLLLNDIYDNYDYDKYYNIRNIIKSLSKDRSPLIRGSVAKVASVYTDEFMHDILMNLSNDKNNIVRLEVADSLRFYLDDDSYKTICNLCNDPYYMVRGYAEYGIGFTGNSEVRKECSLDIVREKLINERRNFNKINCLIALYYLGNKSQLDNIFDMYRKVNYSDKCLILNFVMEIVTEDNQEQLHFFAEKYKSENDLPVVCLIKQLLEKTEVDNTGDGSVLTKRH